MLAASEAYGMFIGFLALVGIGALVVLRGKAKDDELTARIEEDRKPYREAAKEKQTVALRADLAADTSNGGAAYLAQDQARDELSRRADLFDDDELAAARTAADAEGDWRYEQLLGRLVDHRKHEASKRNEERRKLREIDNPT